MAVEQNGPGPGRENEQDAMDSLEVWNEGRLAGYLWREPVRGKMGFRYHPQWLEEGGFALSKSLPLRRQPFEPGEEIAHRFFANLLPEADARSRAVFALKIPDVDFDLLRAVGGECAGALSILPPPSYQARGWAPGGSLDQGRDLAADRRYRKLDDKELAGMAATYGPIMVWDDEGRPRLSLAGAQGKCPVAAGDDGFYLPEHAAPTSHILKFESPHYRNVPAYETFTTMLAGAVGLPVVDIQLRAIDEGYMAVVGRYDREFLSEETPVPAIRRLHQEDFCQALGYDHMQKYQEDRGPSFADCCQLVRETCKKPEDDVQFLLHWQIFNVLGGNSDGHAKNLSLLYLPDGEVRLAPFYDLVCTRAIARLSRKIAFFVGGESDPGRLAAKHWKQLAQDCEVSPSRVLNLLQETAASLQQQMQPTLHAFAERYGPYPALQRVEQVITKQCRRALKPDFYA